ncbi:MAG: HD domain-containing protein [Clostridia bacterium]|nr:HD domain-containing protein [Clostridia bacterium]
MLNKPYEEYEKWFDSFSLNYYDHEDGVSKDYMHLKMVHTKKVVEAIEQIAKSINLSSEDIILAKLIGLLHDVGRFPQIHKYKIDNDNLTENHALLGIKVIKELDLLKDEDEVNRNIILKSIEYHNILSIPNEEKDDRVILFSKLIRDADKVDIYRVMLTDIYSYPIDKLKELYSNLSFESKLSDEIYYPLKDRKNVSRKDIVTFLDHIMMQMSWVTSDINYNESKKMIRDNHYIEKLYELADPDDRGTEIYNMIMSDLGGIDD